MDRQQVLRLDGDDADGGPSSLLVFRLSNGIRIVVTETGGADASVLLSRDQAEALVKKLSQSLGGKVE